jgi:hypothetical protein
VDSKHIDQVRSFSYLGAILNGNNIPDEEIRDWVAKRNKAFYTKKTLF